jgi:hypothetical protein
VAATVPPGKRFSRTTAVAGLVLLLLGLALANLPGAEGAVPAEGRTVRSLRSIRVRPSAAALSERRSTPTPEPVEGQEDGGDIAVRVDFDSSPAVVRLAILRYVERLYPQAIPYLKWNSGGTAVSASSMGASGSITLRGSGPTVVEVTGGIGFPASLFVSEKTVRRGLDQAIREIKKKTS